MNKFPVKREVVSMETGEVVKTETVDFLIMPAPEGTCPDCATAHGPDWPHNAKSLHYQYVFYGRHGRWPNWKDAMAHCTPEMREAWTVELAAKGVDVEGGQVSPAN